MDDRMRDVDNEHTQLGINPAVQSSAGLAGLYPFKAQRPCERLVLPLSACYRPLQSVSPASAPTNEAGSSSNEVGAPCKDDGADHLRVITSLLSAGINISMADNRNSTRMCRAALNEHRTART